MNNLISPRTNLFRILLIFFVTLQSMLAASAQNYWDKIPQLTSECYSEKDAFNSRIEEVRSELERRIAASKSQAEEKASKMTDAEKMAVATRYQKMSPSEIMKMQTDMAEFTQQMTTYQERAAKFEDEYNELEAAYQKDYNAKLDKIEAEYRKLPDGEGTPDWAIKKGKELTIQYNAEYELLCSKYFTTPDALFQVWLKEFNEFLKNEEVPMTEKQIRLEYAQFGIEPDQSVATIMAVQKYLDRCLQIFNLRRAHPQG